MKAVNINLSEAKVKDIQEFVGILAKHHTVDLDLKAGRYTVDARSLIGIFALDMAKPIEFIIHSDDEAIVNAILADIKQWIA